MKFLRDQIIFCSIVELPCVVQCTRFLELRKRIRRRMQLIFAVAAAATSGHCCACASARACASASGSAAASDSASAVLVAVHCCCHCCGKTGERRRTNVHICVSLIISYRETSRDAFLYILGTSLEHRCYYFQKKSGGD